MDNVKYIVILVSKMFLSQSYSNVLILKMYGNMMRGYNANLLVKETMELYQQSTHFPCEPYHVKAYRLDSLLSSIALQSPLCDCVHLKVECDAQ